MAEDHAETKEDLGLSRVALLRNPAYHPSGTKIYVSLMARHGFKPTKSGPYCYRNRMHQRGLANVPGVVGGRCSDAVYLCEAEVGTPAQKLKLELNTGSSELWVCAPSQNLGSDSPGSFDTERSTSYRSMSSSWMAKGGDGSSASGGTGFDQVSTGGLRVKEQVIQLATHIEGHPVPRGADGCLGLSIPQTKTITENGVPDPQYTHITNLMLRSELPKDAQLFTAVFDRSGDKEDEAFCTFRHINQKKTPESCRRSGGYIVG
ncbi:hypothetical protein RB594_001663 [Gaeumannomyces avenae]